MKKMTAIEWYDTQLKEIDFKLQSGLINFDQCKVLLSEAIEQAIQMEKDQIIDFHVNCMEDGYNIETEKLLTEDLKLDIKAHAEQYYNETFKSE